MLFSNVFRRVSSYAVKRICYNVAPCFGQGGLVVTRAMFCGGVNSPGQLDIAKENSSISEKSLSSEQQEKNDFNVSAEQRKKRVFVGNLSTRATEDDLMDCFKSVGDVVSAKVMRNPDGSSKRCALVEFTSADSVQEAIIKLNRSLFLGRSLVVRHDTMNREGRRKADRAIIFSPTSIESKQKMKFMLTRLSPILRRSHTAFVGNLPFQLTVNELRDHFESAGYLVSSAQIFMTRDSPPVSKCCGKVVFEEGTHILDVIEQFNGSELSGRKMLVKEDELREERIHSNSKSEVRKHVTRSVVWNELDKTIDFTEPQDGDVDPVRTIFISNLAYSVTNKDLVYHINDVLGSEIATGDGILNVTKVRMLLDSDGRSRGRAFVELDRAFTAQLAVDVMNLSTFHGRQVFVRLMVIH